MYLTDQENRVGSPPAIAACSFHELACHAYWMPTTCSTELHNAHDSDRPDHGLHATKTESPDTTSLTTGPDANTKHLLQDFFKHYIGVNLFSSVLYVYRLRRIYDDQDRFGF
jgi:hypothetical protein